MILAAMVGFALVDGDAFMVSLLPGPLIAAVTGILITRHRPGHPMGGLLSAFGFVTGVCDFALAYGRAAVVHFPGVLPFGRAAEWLTSWDWVPAECLGAIILPLLFPYGRLLSRRWRPVVWAALAYLLLALAGNAFAPGSLGGWFGDARNPYAVPGPAFVVVLDVASGCGAAVAAATIVSIVLRWRRAGHVERQQLRLLIATTPPAITGGVIAQYFPDAGAWGITAGALGGALMAAGIGLGVSRYRLYEIDVLLSRAIGYGILSVSVGGLYLAVVAGAGRAFGGGSGLSLQLLAAVVAAGVLLPAHRRLQRRVDRLYFGDRGSPYAAMTRLGQQVEATAAGPVLSSVAGVVADTLRLPYAAVQLRAGDGWTDSDSWGSPPKPAEVVTFPLTFQGETVGRLLVGRRAAREQLSHDDERLLGNFARQVAPAAHAVALRQSLDASRADLVTAREEERRRLRRDLHDDLGPTIAALVLGLDNACTMTADLPGLPDLLRKLKAESQRAMDDIRAIAYGLRPSALDELGLVEALRQAAVRVAPGAPGLSVSLQAGPLPQLPAAVEVAAYRIVTECVTNVVRHAQARRCDIRIEATGSGLSLDVRDDGTGMPDGWRAGVGVTAMRERAAELGGVLAIGPVAHLAVPGAGTRVTATLPIAAVPPAGAP
jgi:signal transduction histidine kinase